MEISLIAPPRTAIDHSSGWRSASNTTLVDLSQAFDQSRMAASPAAAQAVMRSVRIAG
jgi:hypothetical protein